MSDNRADTEVPLSEEELFPSLQKLATERKRGRIPFVQQLEWADCGAASLCMVLAYLGHETSLEIVREAVGVSGRDGADALGIIRAGEGFGLRGRGISLDIEHLHFLPPGSILHWQFNHFVVFQRMTKKGCEIVDPAMGPRVVPLGDLANSFTGVALVFERTDSFKPRKKDQNRMSWYLSMLASQRKVLTSIVVTSLMLRLFALAMPLLTALIVDRVAPRNDYHLLWVVMAGAAGMLGFQFVTQLIRSHLMLQLRTNVDTRLTLGLVEYLTLLPYDFFQRRPKGDLLMRVGNNAQLRELLTSQILSTMVDGLLVLVYAVMIFIASPTTGMITILIVIVQIATYLFVRRAVRDLAARAIEAQSRSQSYLVEVLTGMATLKASAAENRAVERWSNFYVDELNVSLERGRLTALTDAMVAFVNAAAPIILLAYGAHLVISQQTSLGTMLAINTLAMGLLSPVGSMVNSFMQFQTVGSHMDRLEEVFNTPPEQTGQGVRPPRLTGAISINNVTFRYSEKSPAVVRNVSLNIAPGSTVAIVGRSGSGKSTLASIIGALYQPSAGTISYDGYDQRHVDLRGLRRQLGVVQQQPYLFGVPVRNNIALSEPNADLDRIIHAAKVAAIHDDIAKMPMGYDTGMGDGGSSLSGGQRQRIAIARAILHNPAVLILDEATSALDSETEAKVVQNLSSLRCTKVILAHRLSTIAAADLIVVMEDGEIIEAGSHRQLLAQGGAYERLVQAQLQGKSV